MARDDRAGRSLIYRADSGTVVERLAVSELSELSGTVVPVVDEMSCASPMVDHSIPLSHFFVRSLEGFYI